MLEFDRRYPTIDSLRLKAQKRMPKFAFDYLDQGCNDDLNRDKNTQALRQVELIPRYLTEAGQSSLETTLFSESYQAPFGVSAVGLQGLMWPKSAEILAEAAHQHQLPFMLSTVSTCSIERIAHITEGQAWFQLYKPKDVTLRNQLIDRAADAGLPVLVLLCDVPTFGYRPRDIKNGLSLPLSPSIKTFFQVLASPRWVVETLKVGMPHFATMAPYMTLSDKLKNLSAFMDTTFSGRFSHEDLKAIRDHWKGKLVLKGVASEADAEIALSLGVDGVIVSNHGGRQLDAGESTIAPLIRIVNQLGDKMTVMMDGGMRSGPDIIRALASGAKFTFLGRPFMYAAGALGNKGGDQAMSILKVQCQQVMEQLCCERITDLPLFKKL